METACIEKVREWLELDNQAQELRNTMNELNEKKKELEDIILKYVEQNNLENVSVSLNDGKLKFAKINFKQSLSLKYIKNTLAKYNEDVTEKVDIVAICKYLTDNLETSSKTTIKRVG